MLFPFGVVACLDVLTCASIARGVVWYDSKQPLDHKRVFIFTNDDNPLRGDADEAKKVHMIAQVTTTASLQPDYQTVSRQVTEDAWGIGCGGSIVF